MQRGYGVVYTIAPSPLRAEEIWAGSDTGRIHITIDGGKNWRDVTPPELSPWSKISIIEASRFDPATAYAAVDRHRLDDRQPYSTSRTTTAKPGSSLSTASPRITLSEPFAKTPNSGTCSSQGPNSASTLSFDSGETLAAAQVQPARHLRARHEYQRQ
jgi:hypothetical protein